MMDFLLKNPILLLLLASWVVSWIGGRVQAAAKRAAEQNKRAERAAAEQRAAGGEVVDADGWPRREPEVVAEARPKPARRSGPDPEQIAREIRRAMGLEPAEASTSTPPVIRRSEPTRSPPREAGPPPAPVHVEIVPDREPGQRRSLRDELEAKALRRDARQAARKKRFDDGLQAHHLEVAIGGQEARRQRRAQRRVTGRLVDLQRPAAAILAAEILGPPIAFRRDHLSRDPLRGN